MTNAVVVRRAAAGVALLVALVSPWAWLSAALGTCAAPWLLRSPSGRRALRRRAHAVVPVLVSLLAAALLVAALGQSASGTWTERAWSIAARVYAAALLLSSITHDLRASALEAGMRSLKLPAALIELVIATRSFGRQLEASMHAAWAAGVLRGGLASWRALAQTVGSVAGIVILRAIDRSERVAVAQQLRGAGHAAADSGDAAGGS